MIWVMVGFRTFVIFYRLKQSLPIKISWFSCGGWLSDELDDALALRSFLSSASIVESGNPQAFGLESIQSHAHYPQTLAPSPSQISKDHESSRVLVAAGLLVGTNWGASRRWFAVAEGPRYRGQKHADRIV